MPPPSKRPLRLLGVVAGVQVALVMALLALPASSDLPAATSRDLENQRAAVGAQLRAGLGGTPAALEAAIDYVRRVERVTTDRTRRADAAALLARVRAARSDWTLARKGFERALSLRDPPVTTGNADFEGIEVYTEALAQEGDNRSALLFADQLVSGRLARFGPDSLQLADALAARAERRQEAAQYLESRKDVERVLAIRRAHLAGAHVDSAAAHWLAGSQEWSRRTRCGGARRVSNGGGDGRGLAWPRPCRGRALPARPRAGSGTTGRPDCRPGHGVAGHRAVRGRAAARSSRACVAGTTISG